ncbi:MAG: hypothetical protein WC622_17045, partial [Pedobacter sp.]|uniref:hypothetical protein n=1 Tax=Pedobacter sp. TaxID=1411316 RepID=UPI003569091D
TEKLQVSGRDDALANVDQIEDLLQQYQSKGGNTNLLSGGIEKFSENVLKYTNNSELATIANQIAIAIQSYRRSVTGAAFSESEAKEYASIFPAIGNVPALNKAKINSIKEVFNRNQENFYKRQMGATNYAKLQNLGAGGTTSTTSNLVPLNRSYTSIAELVKENPGYSNAIKEAKSNGYSESEILQFLEQGFNQGSGGTPKATGMRTDRHNNPTAFTTDIARIAGLKEGVDYVVGDSFSNGRYKTARLLGDPVDTTIKVIDKIGFYTDSGEQRWKHTAMSKSKWNNLSYEQKKNVIKQMYQREGGSQLLNKFA